MKTSLEWLRDFTPVEGNIHDICEALTISGSKVEGYEIQGEEIQKVVSGRILKIEKHPDADRLVVCQVDTGNEQIQIVTGADNIAEGDHVPVALIGSTLAGGIKIKKGKLRGVVSEGMMCSVQELGYTTAEFPEACEDGIFILDSDTPLGLDIRDILGINDTIIEFEITSNRVDCFAVEGLAREAAVTFDLPFAAKEPNVKAMSKEKSGEKASIEIQSPDLCYRYCGRVIENVRVEPSPAWLRRRLRAAGVRPINNLVDITNYVMLELGQPMHAFDLQDLEGQRIIVRRAYENEKITTLDSVERVLDPDMLVIADTDRAVALAGVMGAENSEIRNETKTVLLESATFNPFAVRMAAKKVGLRTEASSRFEKGLDVNNASRALDRACELIEQLECGEVCQGVIDVWPVKKDAQVISLSANKINRLLGTKIPLAEMMDILTSLGCEISNSCSMIEDDEIVEVTVPSFRPDLETSADLAEEIARIFDYNNIEPTLLSGKAATMGGRSQKQKLIEKIKDLMIGQSCYEALTYSFESPKQLDKMQLPADHDLRRSVRILNPLGEDFSNMRTSMVPSLLQIAAGNSNRSVEAVSLFEVAYTYHPKQLPLTELPEEVRHLAAVCYDLKVGKEKTFARVKGIFENLIDNLGITDDRFTVKRSESKPWLHPGQSADLFIDDTYVGWIGSVHPDCAESFEAPDQTVLMDILIDRIGEKAVYERKFKAMPKFPAVERDLSLLCDHLMLVDDLKTVIRNNAGLLLESVELFDVYQGSQIGAGKKSVAFNLKFRSAEKTLNEDDIKPSMTKVLKGLAEIGAVLRE
ncbi:MAG: phenylalanine--tRNA ligase subunit beta [Eubacteriales bacterium]|nr:phenylalanine--tRNA ligase subunit beta [Eubacteriales bacterium]